ncbi:MAG: rRNA pseudouridine synthase [Planctomycetes bacterium]|nr:rRNA pseudouridine synthase [Planctomycetota bacterium]
MNMFNKRFSKPRKKAGKPERQVPAGMIRLQKILAEAGVDSRRKCEELILDGAVTVNGHTLSELPAFADPETDDIRVHGRRLHKPQRVYFLFNKPKNIICTNFDPQGRRKVIDYIDCDERIFCVGRLDADTTGAILLTNDSELANRLTHPKFELSKTYEVTLRGKVEGEVIEKIKTGVWLSEGKTQKAFVKVLRRNNLETVLEISLSQSLNRQIHRIMARVGFKVKSLKRTFIGNIRLKGLGPGEWRHLTGSEVEYLYKATQAEKTLKKVRKEPAVIKQAVTKRQD